MFLLTYDKSVRVTEHSYSSAVDSCYGEPVSSAWFESRDLKVVLATVHCPVLVLLLLRIHTPHLSVETGLVMFVPSNVHSFLGGDTTTVTQVVSGSYLVALDDTIVGFMRRGLPVQVDGVILLMAHGYGHSQRRSTGHCRQSKLELIIFSSC